LSIPFIKIVGETLCFKCSPRSNQKLY